MPSFPSSGQKVAEEHLAEFLALYPSEHRYVSEVDYADCQLKARLEHFAYPFTAEDLDYVTATQIPLYLSQLIYVLLGSVIRFGDSPDLPPSLERTYFEQMRAGRLFFVQVNQKMTGPMWKNAPLSASLVLNSVRRHRGSLFGFVSFSFNDGACAGELKIAMEEPA